MMVDRCKACARLNTSVVESYRRLTRSHLNERHAEQQGRGRLSMSSQSVESLDGGGGCGESRDTVGRFDSANGLGAHRIRRRRENPGRSWALESHTWLHSAPKRAPVRRSHERFQSCPRELTTSVAIGL